MVIVGDIFFEYSSFETHYHTWTHLDAEVKSFYYDGEDLHIYAVMNILKRMELYLEIWVVGTDINLKEKNIPENAIFLDSFKDINQDIKHVFYTLTPISTQKIEVK